MKREITFEIVDKKNEKRHLSMKIPTGGELVQIENMKALSSANNYRGITSTNSIGSNHALDLVDMNAYFSILCPKIIEAMEVKSLLDLDVFDLQIIKDVFDTVVVPWVNDWQAALRDLTPLNQKENKDLTQEEVKDIVTEELPEIKPSPKVEVIDHSSSKEDTGA